MSSYRDPNDFSRVHVMQRVMDSMRQEGFSMDKVIQYSMLARMEEDEDEVSGLELVTGYGLEWDNNQQKYVLHKKKSRPISYAEFIDCWDNGYGEPSEDSEDEDSEAERQERILQEKKNKIKAEKKRLKKQRQKEKKRQQKEQESPPTQDKESSDVNEASPQDKAGDEAGDDKAKDCFNLKDMAAALESDSSDDTSDGSSNEEHEGLDLASCFVSKAAEIVKRQLEHKQEIKEKKNKSPVKEEQKVPEKSTCEENQVENHVEKKVTYTPSPKMEDYVKMSTDLAMIGNKQASAGNFKLAVTYFTDAIKFNPTEFRLFGNRAFCFEKLQEFDKALNDAELALCMSPGWVKGLFRKGRALAGLKRYEEAANAFKEVIKLDQSCTEANQELLRMQTLQLMEFGFTQDQSSKALTIHGSVEKAREALSKLKSQPVPPVVPQQVVNVTGLSPILSAKMTSAAAVVPLPPARLVSANPPEPLVPVQSLRTLARPVDPEPSKPNDVLQAPELFPIWVGNLSFSVTESQLSSLFNKVGRIFSMKHLPAKRCAFINFTQQQECDAAIRIYHGYELLGLKLAVRYPDRIPTGMNISRSAHKSTDVQDEHVGPNLFPAGRSGYTKAFYPNYRGPYKY